MVMALRFFVQARMSSARFPGKVLAPFLGCPMIRAILNRLQARVDDPGQIVVLTSQDETDDPLAAYLNSQGVQCFRGTLENVFERFRQALKKYPCDAFFRVCGDSPIVNGSLVETFVKRWQTGKFDLITNTFPRSFPKGHSLELIRSKVFEAMDPGTLSEGEREHITQVFYANPSRFRIENVSSGNPALAPRNLSVDCLEDLRSIEQLVRTYGEESEALYQGLLSLRSGKA